MSSRRTHVILPGELVEEIDSIVGKRSRSRFITTAIERELKALRQLEAFKEAVGALSSEEHPEWAEGSASWVQQLRQEWEPRIERLPKS